MSDFTLRIENRIAVITFDCKGEKVNKLTLENMTVLSDLIDKIHKDPLSVDCVLIRSGKPGHFAAGADISIINSISTPEQGFDLARQGQLIFDKISNLITPTVALINGACMGGGTELILACDYRVVTDHEKVQIALPEVSLGIIPGFGGCVRLAKLIGLQASIPLVVASKPVNGKKALRLGLADHYINDVFQHDGVLEFCAKLKMPPYVRKLKKKRGPSGMGAMLLEKNIIGRTLLKRMATKSILNNTKGHYPAPLVALSVMFYSYPRAISKGLKREARQFSKIIETPVAKRLLGLFFKNEAMKKETWVSGKVKPLDISSIGVLGAGLMGGGIAWLSSYRVGATRVKDISRDALSKAYMAASDIYDQLIKIRKVSKAQKAQYINRITSTLDYSGFKKVDIVIEAIVEKMDVKKAVFKELEGHVSKDTIIASNTSALSITEMASVLKIPDRFIGFHFFSPVNRMPLVEIIPGEHTSSKTIATAVALARAFKKTPVVVKNCPGFLVNRILMPYLVEAIHMVSEGISPKRIDRVAVEFGLPVGPLTLADEVGLDVGLKVIDELVRGYGDRMRAPDIMGILNHDGLFLGKKSGKGFYDYGDSGKPVSDEVKRLLHSSNMQSSSVDVVLDRLILVMVNEASRCLSEDVVSMPGYLDMAMIMGTGFPPFRGGLLAYADHYGIQKVVDRLNEFSDKYGSRFEPAPFLVDLAKNNNAFYK